MEERELVRLLRRAGDQVTPGPPPVRDILREGRALQQRRSGRIRVFAVAAAAAAVVGGGSLAATVLDLPSLGGADSAESAAGGGQAMDDSGAGGGAESAPTSEGRSGEDDEGFAAADTVGTLVVTPDPVRPGETVELSSGDEEATFGLPWRLERRVGDGWTWEYTLKAASGASGPSWWLAEEERALEQPLIPGPVTLVIPPPAAPGDYRICQYDGTADVCGLLTVTG